ncbi:MAG: hypothetical protein C4295_10700 [Candidatus Fervidibacterota bacterium]
MLAKPRELLGQKSNPSVNASALRQHFCPRQKSGSAKTKPTKAGSVLKVVGRARLLVSQFCLGKSMVLPFFGAVWKPPPYISPASWE